VSLTTKETYEEFENQGYKVSYNPPGNGNCQFATVAHHLLNIGILRSPETLRDEVCKNIWKSMTVHQMECLLSSS